jgi:hypothetical protein
MFVRSVSASGPRFAAALLCVASLGLAGCGESSSEKAAKNVCSATKEISAQITKLQALPVSSNFPTEAKTSFEAISTSVKKIQESAPNLDSARREEIDAANAAFQREIAKITKDVVTATSSSNLNSALKTVEPQIKASLEALGTSYKKAYEALKCSA